MNHHRRRWWAAALLLATLAAEGCSRPPKIVVGSMSSTAQLLLGEIVAQHLEHRLHRTVERRPNLGGTLGAYQALQSGEVSVYPEYASSIVTEILKEQPAGGASLIFERARSEMKRIAQAELLPPLGLDNSYVAVIRAGDSREADVSTLSEGAEVKEAWVVGASPEFQRLPDGMPALLQYRLPMKTAPFSISADLLFDALRRNTVTMIIARATDGSLTQPEWKTLRDDRSRLTSKQACLLAGPNLLLSPGVRAALEELSGKVTTEKMRHLDALVDRGYLPRKDVAASFLEEVGLR